ncbi:MAG: hypothetical protein IJC26_02360 [Clostridia bacterium]|nr:hypothetical protein [Clostridia bacterium]
MKIGFGRVDITPPLGTQITGAWQLREADGVMDPLELNSIVFEIGEEKIAIVTADFLSMPEGTATPIRNLIAKEIGIPAQNILMQCLHQHTATTPGNTSFASAEYNNVLKRKYVDVVRLALNDLAEATMSRAEKQTCEEVSFIRRYRMKDGTVMTNPGTMNPDIDHPLGQSDNTVRLVRFTREDAKDIALVAFQTHPDTIGGTEFSADWPGFARRKVEKELPDVHCILMNGCQGDTNHHKPGRPQISKKLQAERYEFTRRMGHIIAQAALDVWNETTPLKEGAVSSAFEITAIRTNLDGIDRIEECKALYEKILVRDEEVMKLPMSEKGAIRRIAKMENYALFQKVPVTMVAFGELAFLGYGGEPFTEYATVLRQEHPELFIITACNCNGSQGYLPSAAAFEEGGYEACTTNFTPETPALLQGLAKKLLAEHKAKL